MCLLVCNLIIFEFWSVKIDEMRTKREIVRVTNAGIEESHMHDVTITKQAPNYRI